MIDGRGLRRLRAALARLPPVAGRGRAPARVLAGALVAGGGRSRARARSTSSASGVEEAIAALGSGFLAHPAQRRAARRAARRRALDTQDYYRELLRLVYRLLFLFVAEDRGLLLDPAAPDEAARALRATTTRRARLRRLAERRRGTPHADLWAGLRLVMRDARRRRRLPGARPARPRQLPLVGRRARRTSTARELAERRPARRRPRAGHDRATARCRRAVDYRNLGAEELGRVYESLLELHPELNADAGTFALDDRRRQRAQDDRQLLHADEPHRRACSTRPSTPSSTRPPAQADPEQALLDLKVCDPACGSRPLPRRRRPPDRQAPRRRPHRRRGALARGDVRTALRDVIGRCIYGVDVNPMAVELCKVSLWLEALEPGQAALLPRPPHPVRQQPARHDPGARRRAASPTTRSSRSRATTRRSRAAGGSGTTQERDGQQALFEAALAIRTDALAARGPLARRPARGLARGASPRRPPATPPRRLRRLPPSAKPPPTPGARRSSRPKAARRARGHDRRPFAALGAATRPRSTRPRRELVERDRPPSTRFFHWPLEFPAVFERGRVRRRARQSAVGAGQAPGEGVLRRADPDDRRRPERGRAEAADRRARERRTRHFAARSATALRAVGRREPPPARTRAATRCAARGDINTYAVFAELMRLARPAPGRSGVIVPDRHRDRRHDEVLLRRPRRRRIARVSLYWFENEEFVFPAVHHATKFCLLTRHRGPR